MARIEFPATKASLSVWTLAALGYVLLGALGLGLSVAPGYASPLFPASGLAVALLLSSGTRAWPGVFIGSLFLDLGVSWVHGDIGWRSGAVAAVIAAGSTIQASAASWLVVRKVGPAWRTLESEQDITHCLLQAGPLACLISASTGTAVLYFSQMVSAPDLLHNWLNWWVGDTFGVMVALPLTLTVIYRRQPPWKARLTVLLPPMLVAVAVAAVAQHWLAHQERLTQQAAIRDQGQKLGHVLEQRFVAHQGAVAALRRVMELNPHLNFPQFRYFTDITLKDNPDISALSINAFLPHEQRAFLESSLALRTGIPDFEIRERDSQGRMVRAADRKEYVAVGYIAPLESNRAAIGFDMMSEPVRADAVARAQNSRKPSMTAPVQLVQDQGMSASVLLMHPAFSRAIDTQVHEGEASDAELFGFAVGVIKVGQMVEIAMRQASLDGLVVQVDDATNSDRSTALYRSSTGAPGDSFFAWHHTMKMADRTWTLTVFPSPQYFQHVHSWTGLAAGAGGLALVVLLQVLLLVTSGRTAIVQRKVAEQTTEIQLKSEALADRNAQLDALFELSPDGMVVLDGSGTVTFTNKAFGRMTGIYPANIVGKAVAVLDAELRLRCESPQHFDGLLSCLSEGGEKLTPVVLNLQIPRPSIINVVGVQRGSCRVDRFFYCRDITHEFEVDQMKSEFITTAAHELRTPITSIYGFAEVLTGEGLDRKTQQECLTIIMRQSELMISILNELLDLARMEARRGRDFQIESRSVQTLVDAVIREFRPPAERPAPVAFVPPGLPLVMVDQTQGRRAILNVLSNAYKYSPGGGDVKIDVIVSEDGDDGRQQVGIRVSDSGIGMTSEQLSHLFERFYRADASGTVLGTGLGMSIVREIVNLHGGEVEVSSRIGKGTTVTIWLPAATVQS